MTNSLAIAASTEPKELAYSKRRSVGILPDDIPVRNIPDGWEWVKFGSVCKVQGGFAFKSSDYQPDGIPLVRISNLVDGQVSFDSDTVFLSSEKVATNMDFLLCRGDSLIAMSGATTGKMAIYNLEIPAFLNQRVGRFRILSKSRCDPKFIALLVASITKRVLKQAYGAAQPNISPAQIEAIEIPLPALPEQQRIVAEIQKQFTRLEAGVTALRRVQANLKRYRASVLKAACEGRLVPTEADLAKTGNRKAAFETGEALLARILTERRKNWQGRGKFKEPAAPNTKKLGTLPDGYAWATFGQICRVQGGFAFKSTDYVKEGVPLVRISNLVNGRVQVADNTVFLPPESAAANPAFLLRKGDVLIAMSGATTGKMATLEEEIPALLNQRVGRFVLSSAEMTNAKFVSYLVMQITQKVLKDAYGAAQPNISPSEIEEMPIPLPPLVEQTRIVAEVERRFSVVEALEAVVSVNLQRATRLRQSILCRAFSGTL